MNRERSVHVVLAAIGIGALLAYLLACQPSWSPDGSKVLFSCAASEPGPTGVAVYDRNTGKTRWVFRAPDGTFCWGQWRRSGKEVIVAWMDAHGNGPLNLGLVSLDSPKPLRTFVLTEFPGGDIRGGNDLLSNEYIWPFLLGSSFPEVGGCLFIGYRGVTRVDLATGELKRLQMGKKHVSLFGNGDTIYYWLSEGSPGNSGNPTEVEIGTVAPNQLSLRPEIRLKTEGVGSLFSPFSSPSLPFVTVAQNGSAQAILVRKGNEHQVVIVAGGKVKQQASLGLSQYDLPAGGLEWSPDAKTIYVPVLSAKKRQLSIAELSLATSAVRMVPLARLRQIEHDTVPYFQIALSPDGKTLAASLTFVSSVEDSRDRTLHLVDLTSPERKITRVPLPPASDENGGEQPGEPATKRRPDLRNDPRLKPSLGVIRPPAPVSGYPAVARERSMVAPGNDDFLADKEAPPKDDVARLKWLLENRRETAHRRVGAIHGMYSAGTTTLDPFFLARTDELKAELALCRTPAERIAVCEEILRTLGKMESQVRARCEAGAPGGSAVECAVATAARLGAAIALLRERLQSAEGAAAEEDKERLKALLPARRDTLRKAFEAADATRRAGTCTVDLPVRVSRDLLLAELELCGGAGDRIAAREKHLDQLKALEDRVNRDEKGRGATGPTLEHWQIKAARLDAEVGLVRERLVGANDETAQADGANLKRLVTERRDTFRKCEERAKEAFDYGNALPDQVLGAQKRMIDCELETCEDLTQRIALREELVEMTTRAERRCKARYEVGGKEGGADEYAAARLARLDAEIALVRERLKAKSAAK